MKKLILLSISAFFWISMMVSAQDIQGTFALKNVETGKYLRPINANRADHAEIIMYTPRVWKCMTWDFRKMGEDTYQLENLFTGKTFQTVSGTLESGVFLEQMPLEKGNKNQLWVFEKEDEAYLIKLKGTDLYLTPTDPDGKVNSRVVLKPLLDGDLQLWTLVEQSPTM